MSYAQFETNSPGETEAVGRRLAFVLPDRGVVSLVGNLGAGKTTLAKGIVEGRGAARPEEVSSPTYTLIHEYGEPPTVYHVDLYRLEAEAEAARLGLDELFEKEALVLVEWGEKFPALLPPTHIKIQISYAGEEKRLIEVFGCEQPDPTHTVPEG